jgi:PTS system fructose-specific IIC component
MTRFVAVTACPTGVAHTFLAAEALEQAAARAGHLIQVETQGSLGTRNALTPEAIAGAEAVIIAADIRVATERFQGKLLVETGCEPAIRTPEAVLGQALDRIRAAAEPALGPATPDVVAITSCPTGIAHTFMAAEGLEAGAKAAGRTIKVETQGSVGAQNALTAGEIAGAQVVVIAADTKVDKARFQGKRVYETSTNAAISDGAAVVRAALAGAQVLAGAPGAAPAPASGTRATPGAYRHLMTGVSHMLPFVTAGGLLIALAFAFGGIYVFDDAHKGTLAWTLFTIGAKSGFALMVPVLAGFIAHSIADRAGLAPGMIGGMIAVSIGAGFFGGIAAGFLAGYTVRWLNRRIRLGRNLDGLKPVLILPLLGTLVVGLLMYYVVGRPVALLLNAVTFWLKGLQGSSAILLGLLLGSMMAFDMGGPINKAAYTFATGLIASEVYGPMAAVMAAGMTAPLAVALATVLFRNRFTAEEREAGKATAVLGLAFITEGAIPFAAKDPFRVIPSLMLGSAVAGALSMVLGCQLRVPHGGFFVLPIPNAVLHLGAYLAAIAAGTLLSAVVLGALKKPLPAA